MTTLRAAAPIHAAGIDLIPVERVWLHRHTDGAKDAPLWAAGGREPVAVVIREGKGVSALDVTGEPVALDALLENVDGLAAALGISPDGDN